MRAVLQRVSRAQVSVGGELAGKIDKGILVLLGIAAGDTEKDSFYLLEKTLNLRIFDDEAGKMNLSLINVGGGLLVVSQFTLYADTRKGRRASFIEAAKPVEANGLYEFFVAEARKIISDVGTGRFQAMMDVELVNDGLVTIFIDSKLAR